MDDLEIEEHRYNFVCFRCGRIIKPGENMVSLSVSIETPTDDDSLQATDSTAISTLCFGCALVLLSQIITRDPSLMMPLPEGVLREDYEEQQKDEPICTEGDQNEQMTRLTICHSPRGFRLILDCGDGVSKATSRLFIWRQVIQMLIAADPNIFGAINEPLHRIFARALSRLGYHVPGYQASQIENNVN